MITKVTAERSWPRTSSTHSGAREVDDSGARSNYLVSTRWVLTEEKPNDRKSDHDLQVEVAGDGKHICCYTSVGIADVHFVAVPIAQEYITVDVCVERVVTLEPHPRHVDLLKITCRLNAKSQAVTSLKAQKIDIYDETLLSVGEATAFRKAMMRLAFVEASQCSYSC